MENGPFIDGFMKKKHVIFHGKLLKNQMVIALVFSGTPLNCLKFVTGQSHGFPGPSMTNVQRIDMGMAQPLG